MVNEQGRSRNSYKHLKLEGTHDALVVYFVDSQIFEEDEIRTTGRELMFAADQAARIDMPLRLSFRNVHGISSALIGQLVLLNKKVTFAGLRLSLCEMSPPVAEVFRRLGGDGPAGVGAS